MPRNRLYELKQNFYLKLCFNSGNMKANEKRNCLCKVSLIVAIEVCLWGYLWEIHLKLCFLLNNSDLIKTNIERDCFFKSSLNVAIGVVLIIIIIIIIIYIYTG